MKPLLVIALLLFVGLILINNLPLTSGSAGLVMNVKYASLPGKPAETRIRIPIRGITENQIADTWQAPRGADRKHEGQDIFARKGTPVYSATDGYVMKVGENQLGGNTVWVIGAGGRVYYYAHLDRYAEGLTEGDEVTPETVLGYVGNTGNAQGTPPHLHFGVYTLRGPINPLSLF